MAVGLPKPRPVGAWVGVPRDSPLASVTDEGYRKKGWGCVVCCARGGGKGDLRAEQRLRGDPSRFGRPRACPASSSRAGIANETRVEGNHETISWYVKCVRARRL